jgi:DNA-binding LacI/PurR family transcriptional regulator/signal transduction histidine kinase/ActR/RegA family two-component response regulator
LDYAHAISGAYEMELRRVFDAKCRRDGYNLLILCGAPLDSPHSLGKADNTLFSVLSSKSFDGFIVASCSLATFSGPERLARLVEGLRPAGVCAFGTPLPGIPSITVDNRSGMEAVVEHMIREHGCAHLAFIAGPPRNSDSEERLRAYKNVLARHGISFDPALVVCANFVGSQTEMAIDELVRRGVPFDGIVAANDAMAMGAIEALRKRGRRVPGEIPVTGFDDLVVARMGSPSLTSVAQPFEDIANLAVDTVVAQLSDQHVRERVSLPTRLVCRQSCGCNELRHSPAQSLVQQCGDQGHPAHLRIESLRPRLQHELRTHADHSASVASKLVEALSATVSGQPGAFRQAVTELLEQTGDRGERHQILREAINWLRDELVPLNNLEMERAFYEALTQVTLSSLGTQYRQQTGAEEVYFRLRAVGGETSTALDLSSLKLALGKGLASAGIRTIFLSCAPSSTSTDLVPLVCLVDGVPVEPGQQVLPADQLVPSLALDLDNRRTFFVFPMALRSRLLGVVAVDYDDGVDAFGPFRSEIALVLRGIHLNQDLVQETMLRERSVQERQATTKRMEALSVLAGGVAHDLNNALGPLVVLPDVILDELGHLPIPPQQLADLRADVASIRTASQRAAQTIKDLLTLGRQGRMTRQELDLNDVVESCLSTKSARSVHRGNSRVGVAVDLCPEPLPMIGAESQLARAVGNLIRNAVEATTGEGKIKVKTARIELNGPTGSYENIPPGSYAVLTVADQGCGIRPADLSRVFEPFFTTKAAGESSGSGLGLAIVHGVVKEHEGYIDVDSTPGEGTTFALYFPLGQVSNLSAGPSKTLSRGHAKILVVDDEVVQLDTYRRVLVRLGHQVEVAQSGLEAYDLFVKAAPSGKSPFDLVILDMVLGEKLDGLQVFELIQRLFPAQKAILASGHAPSARAEEAMRKGLPWLTKPYDRETLAHAVEKALAGASEPGSKAG